MIVRLLLAAASALSMTGHAAAPPVTLAIVSQSRAPVQTIGPLDEEPIAEALAGARLGMADNNTTGRFIGRSFRLVERSLSTDDDAAATLREFAAQGIHYVIADLDAAPLLAAADAVRATPVLLFNSRAPDDELRAAQCRANVLHTIPSRAMLADALAQYLAWKRWSEWLLVIGPAAGDQQLAHAYRRAAKRFGATIVEEKRWTFKAGHGRADTGHVVLQTELPVLTRGRDHDVLVVADETEQFGPWLEGRTARARPVAGTHALVTTGWSPVAEQWGSSQLQSRFRRQAGRWMNARDYAAWLAARSVGEAVIRSNSADPAAVGAYLRGPQFQLAGFKGRAHSFREWDGQMRQPVLIAGSRLLVSVSPQPGFLHRRTELDTLGVDKEESECRF